MNFSSNSLYNFITSSTYTFQSQAEFEFRYPVLFNENSFKIDQLSFPTIDTHVGNVYINGYEIPVHSMPKFEHEINFTMYVEEEFLLGEYGLIFSTILSEHHDIARIDTFYNRTSNITNGVNTTPDLIYAYIIPTSHNSKLPVEDFSRDQAEYDAAFDISKYQNYLVLENALIKSISMAGSFSANSTTLTKFDVKMTFSQFYPKIFN